jgi:hypothetical protein
MTNKEKYDNPLINREPWQVTCRRFVGFIDIMGFKDIVLRNTHEEVYKKLMTISDFRDLAQNRIISSVNPPKVFIFSDSIIVFSKDDSESAMCELLFNMGHLIQVLTKNVIPFRGGIACGEMTVDDEHSIFFGQPLIDSFLLSEELALYAVAIHHTAEKSIIADELGREMVFEYNTPTKAGKAKQYLVCSFVYYFIGAEIPKKIDYGELMANYRTMTSGAIRKYIDNTEEFFQTIFELHYKIEEEERAASK